MKLPSSYFDSKELIESIDGYKDPIDTKKSVAIIGAGLSGLIIGNELIKKGFEKVTLYEQGGRIGGRVFTHRFSSDPAAGAEVGAMRVPQDHYFVNRLIERYGIKTVPFPDALKSDTCVFFDGKRFDIEEGANLPDEISAVKEKWKNLIDPVVTDVTSGDFSTSWEKLSAIYKDKSFFDVLKESGWSEREMHVLGSIGIASGGLNTFFENSFLEIIKMVKLAPKDRLMIVGGIRTASPEDLQRGARGRRQKTQPCRPAPERPFARRPQDIQVERQGARRGRSRHRKRVRSAGRHLPPQMPRARHPRRRRAFP